MKRNRVIKVRVDSGKLHADAELRDEELGDTRIGGERRNRGLGLREGERQIKDSRLQQQKSNPGSVVRWDRFLPQRQLRVLLVEDDDSTRHIVTALLRNCCYEVTSAASGLIALDLLGDGNNHFDLILTEVVMPCLSGISLLCKITAHEAYKHIPVIMMSSLDSMGIVFKCLSKGAVDFLVKPVRKNELKNLWQHVWRRCYNSAGVGSGIQTQKHPGGAKSGIGSSNGNVGSSDESDSASGILNMHDGSDKGSGTQTSWTRKIVEVESPAHRNVWDNAHPDVGPSTELPTAAKTEKLHSDWVRELALGNEPHVSKNDRAVYELQIPAARLAADVKYLKEMKSLHGCAHKMEENTISRHIGEEGKMYLEIGWCRDHSTKAIDLIGAIEEKQGDKEDATDEGTDSIPKSKDKTVSDSNFLPTLELSLKRPHSSVGVDQNGGGKRVLQYSGSSAFSRYYTPGNHTQLPSPKSSPVNIYSGYAGGPSFMKGSVVGKSDPMDVWFAMPQDRAGPSKDDDAVAMAEQVHPCLLHANEKEDTNLETVCPGQDGIGAAGVKEEAVQVPALPGPSMQMLIPFPGASILGYDGISSADGSMHPMFYSYPTSAPWGSATLSLVADKGENPDQSGHKQPHEHPQNHQYSHHHNHHHHAQHHHHHHHHHYQHLANLLTQQQDEQTVTNVGTGAPRGGSSNIPKGNNGQSRSSNRYGSNGNGNGSVNGSAVGSNNASNGHNGQNGTGLPARGNGDSGTQNGNTGTGASNCLTNGNAGSAVVVMADQNCVGRQEAALTKFRHKRKERCFQKKGRYQSRKKFAEQRPQVRGQFVRLSVFESTAGEHEKAL